MQQWRDALQHLHRVFVRSDAISVRYRLTVGGLLAAPARLLTSVELYDALEHQRERDVDDNADRASKP